MQEDQNQKNKKILRKYLRNQLDSFAKITQWTDLGNWLQKTAKYLEQYPTNDPPYKKELALNLSKCLSEQLPIGIHRTTLNIYNIIFKQMKDSSNVFAKNLAIYSFGLFPFFPKSSIQVKPDLIQLFNQYYLPLKLDLIPLLTGLLNSLLPGLEEQDQTIQNLLIQLFKDINKAVGDKYFMSTFWFVLIKNPKNRLSALKIMNMKFSKLFVSCDNEINIETENSQLKKTIDDINQTNNQINGLLIQPSLVINAICRCLEDQDISVVKKCLDFFISNKIIQNQSFFEKYHFQALCSAILNLMKNNDLSLIKRFFKLLFEENQPSQFQVNEKNQEIVDIFVDQFQKLLIQLQIEQINCSTPFQILLTIKQNSEFLMEYFYEVIPYDLLQFSAKFYLQSSDQELKNEIISQIEIFFEKHKNKNNDFLKTVFNKFEEFQNISFQQASFILFKIIPKNFADNELKILTLLKLIKLVQKTQNEKLLQDNINEENISQYLIFTKDFLIQLEKFLSIGINSNKNEVFKILGEVQDEFCTFFDKIIQNKVDFLEKNFSQYLQALVQFEEILNQEENCEKIENFEQIPLWYQNVLKYCFMEIEFISYQSIKLVYRLFNIQESVQRIKNFQEFIFQKQENYEENKICEQFLQKLLELIEVSDFQFITLQFLEKIVELNKEFVINYLLKLLDVQKAQKFRKVALLWKVTEQKSEIFKEILSKTVFKMISFIKINDSLIRSYFKDWLIQTQNNFSLILAVVIEKLNSYTEWKIEDNQVMYMNWFDCESLSETLKSLEIILEYGKQNFITYMIDMKLPETFIQENIKIQNSFIDTSLYKVVEQENYSYLTFLIRLLFRFIRGEPAIELLSQNEKNLENLEKFQNIKLQILIFMEKIFQSFENKISCEFSLILLPLCIKQLQNSIKNSETTLQLEYLNLISYFLYKTNLIIDNNYLDRVKEIILEENFLKTFLMGLKNDHSFVIKEYSIFFEQLYVIISKIFSHPHLTQQIKIILSYLSDLIEEQCTRINSIKEQERMKEKIRLLIQCLSKCLNFFFGVQETQQVVSARKIEKAFLTVFTLGIINQKDSIIKKADFIINSETIQNLQNYFETLFLRLINSWKEIKYIYQVNIFQQVNENERLLNEIEEETYGISKYILNVFQNLYLQFPIRSIEAFLNNWMSHIELLSIEQILEQESIFFNLKIIEIIIQLQTDPISFLSYFNQLQPIQNIQQLERYKTKEYTIIQPLATDYEVGVLSFLYAYLKYCKIDNNIITEYYQEILNILKKFEDSKTPQTLLWIIDIIDLITYQISVDELSYKIKHEWRQFMRNLFQKIFQIIIGKINFQYSEGRESCKITLPLNPSFLSYLKGREKQIKIKTCHNEEDLIIGLLNFNENSMFIIRYKIILLYTLQLKATKLLNCFFTSQGYKIYNTQKIRTFFEYIFEIFQKQGIDNILVLNSSKLIEILGRENQNFYKEYKKEILVIFNRDDFFKVQQEVLKIWSQIIDKFLEQSNIDLVSEHLENINFKSLFSNKTIENKKRIKTFQRICFIVFSGSKEKYMDENKLKQFLEKIRDVLAEKKVHPNLLVLILFGIRIFLIRLRKETLERHFKFLWRWIVFLLYRILRKKQENKSQDTRVIIAALKLLELMSHMEIEEFSLHKWAFIFENFSVNLKIDEQQEQKSPFLLNPLLSYHLPEKTVIEYGYKMEENENQFERKIIFDKNLLEQEELQKKIDSFLKSIIHGIFYKKRIDIKQIEELIQQDFLEFAEYTNIQLIIFIFVFTQQFFHFTIMNILNLIFFFVTIQNRKQYSQANINHCSQKKTFLTIFYIFLFFNIQTQNTWHEKCQCCKITLINKPKQQLQQSK